MWYLTYTKNIQGENTKIKVYFRQVELRQTKKLWLSKGNNQQSKKSTCGMGENICHGIFLQCSQIVLCSTPLRAGERHGNMKNFKRRNISLQKKPTINTNKNIKFSKYYE